MTLYEIDRNGKNLLHIAVQARHSQSAFCLLQLAAQSESLKFFYNHKDNCGKTAQDYAYETQQSEMIKIFKDFLIPFAQECKLSLKDSLLQKEKDGKNCFHVAIFSNPDTKILQKLIDIAKKENCYDEILRSCDNFNLTPLELAELLQKENFSQLLQVKDKPVSKNISKAAIQFYYLEKVKINGNNILQEHVIQKNSQAVEKLKVIALQVQGLWQKMLQNRNYDQKTALELAESDSIRNLLN